MTSKIPVYRPAHARRRPGLAPLLCLLAVLVLHALALREVPFWLAPAAQARAQGETEGASGPSRTVSTRMIPAPPVLPPTPETAPSSTDPTTPPTAATRTGSPRPQRLAAGPAATTAPATAATTAGSVAPASASPAAPIQLPPPIRLDYRLQRGAIAGDARLDWRHDGRHYSLDLEGQLPLIGTLMHQHSEGGFDAAGLAPQRYTEKRLRRSERAVNFNRPADGQPGRITFSASTAEAALRPGAQDRLSWMVQLAARLAGSQNLPASGARIEMDVASAGGEVQDWHFVLQGRTPDGSWHWRRDTGSTDATLAEVWTDPAAGHLPRRVRLTERQGEPIELVLQRR